MIRAAGLLLLGASLLACSTHSAMPCMTGIELRIDGGEERYRTGEFKDTTRTVRGGISIFYDTTGACQTIKREMIRAGGQRGEG